MKFLLVVAEEILFQNS